MGRSNRENFPGLEQTRKNRGPKDFTLPLTEPCPLTAHWVTNELLSGLGMSLLSALGQHGHDMPHNPIKFVTEREIYIEKM